MLVGKKATAILFAMAVAAMMSLSGVTPAGAQPPAVWVDDDWAGASPGDAVDGHIFGTDAFARIQDGIDAVASRGTVHVVAGIYFEGIDFRGKAITVQSESGAENTTIDAGGERTGVTLTSGEKIDSVLNGFTIIKAGGLNNAAIRCYTGSATITNNIIKDNNVPAILLYKSNSIIKTNMIFGIPNNISYQAAIYLSEASPTIENNTILATDPNGSISAIYIGDSEGDLAQNFRIRSNIIKGRIFLSLWSREIEFKNEISNNLIVIENGFSEAINVNIDGPANLLIVNNTIVKGGGIFLQRGGYKTAVVNNIISESTTGIQSWDGYSQIFNNNLWKNQQNYYGIPDQTRINGNISADPMFVDPVNGNYHLIAYSPCIGLGTVAGAPNTDIEGSPRPNPPGSDPDIGAYENSRAIRDAPPLDFFGMEVGNEYTAQGTSQGGSYNSQSEIVSLDYTTFSVTTYVVESWKNGTFYSRDWYEKKSGEYRWWGFYDPEFGDFYKGSKGLLVAWNPMNVGEHKSTSGTFSVSGVKLNASLTADVLSKELVFISLGTFEAYKLKYQLRIWTSGYDETDTWFEWFVPYLGTIRAEDTDYMEELTSFAIAGGTVTETTDTDRDGLKDYEEIFFHHTNWVDQDTDHDAMPDGWEVNNGLDPSKNDAPADADGDGFSNLREYHLGTDPSDPSSHPPKGLPWILLLLGD